MKLKLLLIILGTLVVVLSALYYINLYLQRSKATDTCITYTPSDYNQDGVINVFDYTIWLNQNPGAVVCPTPTPSLIVLNVKEDTYVNSNYPDNNSGTEGSLRVKASPEKITYMKFDLAALAGKIINSAKLRLWVSDPSNGFMEIHSVQDNLWNDKGETDFIWTEKDLTYNSRPYPDLGNLIQSFTAATSGTYKEIDITGIIQKNRGKLMSLEFQTSSLNELEFKSRNVADQAKKPVLIIDASTPIENKPPVIISSWLEGLQYASPGSRYPYTATLDQDYLDPMIYGYDLTDDVTAAIEMIQPDGSIVNTHVDIDLPLGEITQTEEPPEFCSQVRCFYIHADNFWPQQIGLHKVTIRVADSKGAQAPPIVYEVMVVSDPPTTPSPTPTPIRCTSNSQCPSYQTCDLATRKCKNLACPIPPQCKYYGYDNHSCALENTYDGTSCLTSGLRGNCTGGICVIIPTPTPTPVKSCLNNYSFRETCSTSNTLSYYRYIDFECADGYSSFGGGPTSCKDTNTWITYATYECAKRPSCQSMPTLTPTLSRQPSPTRTPTLAPWPS